MVDVDHRHERELIRYRGYAIEELIGRIGFADMVYLMTRASSPASRCRQAA